MSRFFPSRHFLRYGMRPTQDKPLAFQAKSRPSIQNSRQQRKRRERPPPAHIRKTPAFGVPGFSHKSKGINGYGSLWRARSWYRISTSKTPRPQLPLPLQLPPLRSYPHRHRRRRQHPPQHRHRPRRRLRQHRHLQLHHRLHQPQTMPPRGRLPEPTPAWEEPTRPPKEYRPLLRNHPSSLSSSASLKKYFLLIQSESLSNVPTYRNN